MTRIGRIGAAAAVSAVVLGGIATGPTRGAAPAAPTGASRPSPQQAVPEPTRTSPASDLARNPSRRGYPHPLESDSGWGGGRDKWDILDGNRVYGLWTNGLAFTGGRRGWVEPCGWRQATIDFGRPVIFDSVSVWWSATKHIPIRYRIQYLAGEEWTDAFSTEDGLAYRRRGGEGTWWDRITDNAFPAVTSTKLRLMLDNCVGQNHGWIYEIEVYGPEMSPDTGLARGPDG